MTQFYMVMLSVLLVFLAASFACIDGMFSPSQMTKLYPVGFPFAANGATWGSFFFLSPALYIIGRHSSEWKVANVALIAFLGVVAMVLVFHLVVLNGKFPDSLAGGGRPISPAGWVMIIDWGLTLAAIFLFYFFSSPTATEVLEVGGLLVLYVVAANHIPLWFLNNHYHFLWCPQIFQEESTPLFITQMESAVVIAATAIRLVKLWL
jgi:hypothetical protein